MNKNTMTISCSFKGIVGTFLKKLIILILLCIFYLFLDNIKNQYYTEYNIVSFFSLITTFANVDIIAIIALIFIFYIIIAILFIREFYKTILLFYNIPAKVIIDYDTMKITLKTYSFPFNVQVDENKFNEIINVVISQDLSKKLFNSGDLYIEFLVNSTLDSQLRNIEIPNISSPFKIKRDLL